MTAAKYDTMSLDELRRYMLTHREDIDAFHTYIERSKAAGRMISVNLNDNLWEEKLQERIQQSTPVDGESKQP